MDLYYPRDRINAILLMLIVAAIYLPFLGNPLVFDDGPFFNSSIVGFADALFEFSFRWFPYSTMGITWVFFGEDPLVFRVQNLLLHGFNVLLLLLVLRLWVSLFVAEPARQQMTNWGAWFGALVFACHPLAVYGTGYLVQRSILMATMFTLVMHLVYFRGLLEGNRRYMAMAVAAYFLAVFSKEHSLLIPAILLPMTWVLKEQVNLKLRPLFFTWVGFAVVALIVVLRTKGVFGQVYEKDAAELFGQQEMLAGVPMLHLLSVLTQAGLFFKYLFLMLVPNPAWMSIDMRETFILAWRDWTSWIGVVAYLAYGVVGLLCLLRGGRLALFGLALLYPWSQFPVEFASIRVQEIFVLYRSYLWMPGMMLLWVLLLGNLPTRRILLAGCLAALLLIPLSWNRLWVLADNYRLWDDAVQLLHGEDRLGAQRVYYGRGYFAAKDNKDWNRAIEDYKKSLQLSSAFPPVRLALAGAYASAGRSQEALAEFDKAIALNPKNADAYYGKAFLLKSQHDNARAMAMMQKSCDLGKTMACAMANLSSQMSKESRTVR